MKAKKACQRNRLGQECAELRSLFICVLEVWAALETTKASEVDGQITYKILRYNSNINNNYNMINYLFFFQLTVTLGSRFSVDSE